MASNKDHLGGREPDGRGATEPSMVRRRWRQARRILHDEGITSLGARALGPLALRVTEKNATLGVRAADVLAADMAAPRASAPAGGRGDGPYTVNWVTTPSTGGSGGHTTMFRIIEHLVANGHRCRIYLYDIGGGHASDHEAAMRRSYPAQGCEILDALDGMADADAVFATAWSTAYVAFNDPCAGKRFYFVQDFEPSFYPWGAEATLAENTYRMGFHAVTAGRWLAEKLTREYAMPADHFDFGCDIARYEVLPDIRRNGIAFYRAPRRGSACVRPGSARVPDLRGGASRHRDPLLR